jgi:hypothetical protein
LHLTDHTLLQQHLVVEYVPDRFFAGVGYWASARAHHASGLCCCLCIVCEKQKLYTSHDGATAMKQDTRAGKAAAAVLCCC